MNQNLQVEHFRLSDQTVGFSGKIQSLHGQQTVVERLLELGFVPGKNISILRKVLWGDPIVIELESISISLRKVEAQSILVSEDTK